MAAHINFVCDEENCDHGNGRNFAQPLFFDSYEETWGDMLSFMEQSGWRLEMNGARVVKATCPNHRKENT